MLSHTRENFTLYPTNRVVAFVDSKLDADEVCCELKDEIGRASCRERV